MLGLLIALAWAGDTDDCEAAGAWAVPAEGEELPSTGQPVVAWRAPLFREDCPADALVVVQYVDGQVEPRPVAGHVTCTVNAARFVPDAPFPQATFVGLGIPDDLGARLGLPDDALELIPAAPRPYVGKVGTVLPTGARATVDVVRSEDSAPPWRITVSSDVAFATADVTLPDGSTITVPRVGLSFGDAGSFPVCGPDLATFADDEPVDLGVVLHQADGSSSDAFVVTATPRVEALGPLDGGCFCGHGRPPPLWAALLALAALLRRSPCGRC